MSGCAFAIDGINAILPGGHEFELPLTHGVHEMFYTVVKVSSHLEGRRLPRSKSDPIAVEVARLGGFRAIPGECTRSAVAIR